MFAAYIVCRLKMTTCIFVLLSIFSKATKSSRIGNPEKNNQFYGGSDGRLMAAETYCESCCEMPDNLTCSRQLESEEIILEEAFFTNSDIRDLAGKWGWYDCWKWYFCGGGKNVSLITTGLEPQVKTKWQTLHKANIEADVCSGITSGTKSCPRPGVFDDLYWIGGFNIYWTAKKTGTKPAPDCDEIWEITAKMEDHFDCNPGGGNTYWVLYTWKWTITCPATCAPTTIPSKNPTRFPSPQLSSNSTSQPGFNAPKYYPSIGEPSPQLDSPKSPAYPVK